MSENPPPKNSLTQLAVSGTTPHHQAFAAGPGPTRYFKMTGRPPNAPIRHLRSVTEQIGRTVSPLIFKANQQMLLLEHRVMFRAYN